MKPLKILFVCIGNTCRSPMAESIMKHWIKEYDLSWQVDSAGLRSWNVGRHPDDRCLKVLEENGLSSDHVAKTVQAVDFLIYDYILAMDEHNLRELKELMKKSGKKPTAKLELLGQYIGRPEDKIIRDPYFCGTLGGFRCAYAQMSDSCQNFISEHMYTG